MVKNRPIPPALIQEAYPQLIQVLALFSALQECAPDGGNEKLDDESVLCTASRAVALASLGGEKVRQIIRSLDAYV